MNENLIRSIIFLAAGLILIFFPEKTYKFQIKLIKRVGVKYKFKENKKSYYYLGTVFIIISIILFVFFT